MPQDNSPNPPKRVVKRVVRKVSSDANGNKPNVSAQQNSNVQQNQEQPTPKKVVRKVVVKRTVAPNSQGTTPQNAPKKIVKRVIRKPVQKTDAEDNSPKKINYKEEIEKLAPTTQTEQVDRNIASSNAQNNKVPNENTVIKSATDAEKKFEQANKQTKKILRKRSKFQKFLRKYSLLLILFFAFSITYFSWTYLVPAVLNFKITSTDVNDFFQPRIGFKVDFSNSVYYTTPQLGIGVRLKNLKLVYPEGRLDDEKMLFLKSRSAIFEVQAIPLLMKTIKFNEFSLRSVNANLYQNKDGKYAYLEQFKSHFNPNAKKYLLEVPDITILSYNMPSFNEQTKEFKKKRGTKMEIPAKMVKEVLQEAPQSNTIMIR